MLPNGIKRARTLADEHYEAGLVDAAYMAIETFCVELGLDAETQKAMVREMVKVWDKATEKDITMDEVIDAREGFLGEKKASQEG